MVWIIVVDFSCNIVAVLARHVFVAHFVSEVAARYVHR